MVDRYLARRLLPPIALATAIAVAATLLLVLLRFGPGLVSSGATPSVVLSLAAWAAVPAAVVALGPAALLGGVVALARMREDGEIGAFSSLGMGPWRLARVPVAISVLVAALVAAVSSWAEPWAMAAVHRRLASVAVTGLARAIDSSPAGRFVSPVPGVTVYTARRGPDGPEGLLVDAGGVVVVARRGAAEPRGDVLRLTADEARVRWGDGRRLSARRLELSLPLGEVAEEAAALVPAELTRTTSSLLSRKRSREESRALSRRVAAPALAGGFALWMLPLGLGRAGRRRGPALAIAALVVAVGHVASRGVEGTIASAWGYALVPAALALGAVLSTLDRRRLVPCVRARFGVPSQSS